MLLSPFFYHLHSAYSAELDDLALDSEGLLVLDARLAQRRQELDFLLAMLETSPEMVAVVFHKGIRFHNPALMEHLLTLEPEELPPWDELAPDLALEHWTEPLVQTVRTQPQGDWFLTVAAALEYWQARQALATPTEAQPQPDEETEDERDERERHQAGADWLAEQGFDRKE